MIALKETDQNQIPASTHDKEVEIGASDEQPTVEEAKSEVILQEEPTSATFFTEKALASSPLNLSPGGDP